MRYNLAMAKIELSGLVPQHVAFIMDGNGRWAKARGLTRSLGHRAALQRLRDLLDHVREVGVKYASFYAFSTENWNRPEDEIDNLFSYLIEFFKKNIDRLEKDGTRILVSGFMDKLPENVRKTCEEAVRRTADNSGFYFNVCLNYGGRDEIVRAAGKFAEDCVSGKEDAASLDERKFAGYLFAPELPDVDLLIRTSGEQRISNFLLYELAYAEFIFTKTMWPDFDAKAFDACLVEFAKRNRRFGGIENA